MFWLHLSLFTGHMWKPWSSADGTSGSYWKGSLGGSTQLEEVHQWSVPLKISWDSSLFLFASQQSHCVSPTVCPPLCASQCVPPIVMHRPKGIDHELKLLKPKQNFSPFVCLGCFASVTENWWTLSGRTHKRMLSVLSSTTNEMHSHWNDYEQKTQKTKGRWGWGSSEPLIHPKVRLAS